jgi:hypothetical protein
MDAGRPGWAGQRWQKKKRRLAQSGPSKDLESHECFLLLVSVRQMACSLFLSFHRDPNFPLVSQLSARGE